MNSVSPLRLLALIMTLLLLVLCSGVPMLAEEEASEAEEEETGFLERKIGDNWILSPVILPIYSPETEFALAIGGLATFSTQPENPTLPRSTISLFAVPSSNGSLGFNADLEGFFAGDFFRSDLELDYDDGVDNYWGVGYEPGREIEKDEDVTEFERKVFEVPLVLSFRLKKGLYMGINADLIDFEIVERSPTMEGDPNIEIRGDEITNVGMGAHLTWDTRDDTLDAWSGGYLNAKATFYRDSIGSDQEFEIYDLDFRKYHQVARPGRTIAWQLAGQTSRGDVPWIRMPTVGSSRDLRGYTQGRFRDLTAAWALIEYRHMTGARLWNLGYSGFAAWVGIGFIGEDFGDFSGHELPNAGIGYRLEVQERRSLRLDVGFGYDEIGIYLNFAEAF